jgi:Lrp/AsnC family transcriptional regulator, leucine-responsive regulatory protein
MGALDKKDMAILRELDFDGRVSISKLARRVRVSKEVANYRLKRLAEQKVILGYIAIIDTYKLGYQMYCMHLRFKDINDETRKQFRNWVAADDNSMRLLYLGGKWHFFVTFLAKNPLEFNKKYDELIEKFGSRIQRKTVSITIEHEHWPYNFLYEKPILKPITIGEPDNIILDKADFHILDILSKKCRTPLVDISIRLKLTANAVKYRIRNLEAKGIIKGYRALINPAFFDLSRYSITLHLSDVSKRKDVMRLLGAQKEVTLVTKMMGTGDVRFEMICKTPLRVYSFIDDINQKLPGIVMDFEDRTILSEEVFDYFPNY